MGAGSLPVAGPLVVAGSFAAAGSGERRGACGRIEAFGGAWGRRRAGGPGAIALRFDAGRESRRPHARDRGVSSGPWFFGGHPVRDCIHRVCRHRGGLLGAVTADGGVLLGGPRLVAGPARLLPDRGGRNGFRARPGQHHDRTGADVGGAVDGQLRREGRVPAGRRGLPLGLHAGQAQQDAVPAAERDVHLPRPDGHRPAVHLTHPPGVGAFRPAAGMAGLPGDRGVPAASRR